MQNSQRKCTSLVILIIILQIAMPPVHTPAKMISQVGKTHKRHHQKKARYQNHPPGTSGKRLIGQRQHAPPGDHFHRQADAHEAEGGGGHLGEYALSVGEGPTVRGVVDHPDPRRVSGGCPAVHHQPGQLPAEEYQPQGE